MSEEAPVVETPVVEAPVPLAVDEPNVAPAEVVPDQKPAEPAPVEPTGEVKPDTAIVPEKPPEKVSQSRFDRKISRLHRERAEAIARADFAERELNETRQRLQPQQDVGEPRLEQFTDMTDYHEAVKEYGKKKGLEEYESKQRKLSQQAYMENVRTSWETKASKADSKYEDFDEIVGDLKPNTPWGLAIMEADNGDDIAYYLGKHLDEVAKFQTMSPLAQARAIGKLEAKLQAEPVVPKTPSKAPAPITPLGGKSGGSSDVPLDTDDINTWMKKENARMKKAGM